MPWAMSPVSSTGLGIVLIKKNSRWLVQMFGEGVWTFWTCWNPLDRAHVFPWQHQCISDVFPMAFKVNEVLRCFFFFSSPAPVWFSRLQKWHQLLETQEKHGGDVQQSRWRVSRVTLSVFRLHVMGLSVWMWWAGEESRELRLVSLDWIWWALGNMWLCSKKTQDKVK